MSFFQMLQSIKKDLERYKPSSSTFLISLMRNFYIHPSFVGVVYYRIGRFLWLSRKNPLFLLGYLIYRFGYIFIRLYSGIELSPRTQIAPGLCILHFGPTVINPDVIAGENLTILHGVTIGETKTGSPRLGNNISIGTGAVILGNIHIGDNATIAARSVVTKDVSENCIVAGIPARPINTLNKDHSHLMT